MPVLSYLLTLCLRFCPMLVNIMLTSQTNNLTETVLSTKNMTCVVNMQVVVKILVGRGFQVIERGMQAFSERHKGSVLQLMRVGVCKQKERARGRQRTVQIICAS